MRKFFGFIIFLTLLFSAAMSVADEPALSIDDQMKSAIAELNTTETNEPINLGLSTQKSGRRAMFLSLLVPGLGEYYLGHNSARIFLGAEAVTWASYGGFKKLADWRREDLNSYTLQHAGVNIEDQDEDYLQILKRYPRSENLPNLSGSYNEAVRRDARYFYESGQIESMEAYEQDNYLTGDEAFTWDSPDSWTEYKVLLHSHRSADQKAFYMTGVAVVNRLVSAIHSAWLARRINKKSDQAKLSFELQTDLADPQARVVMNVTY